MMFELRLQALFRLHKNKKIIYKYAFFSLFCSLCSCVSFLIACISLVNGIRIILAELPLIGLLWHSKTGIIPAVIFLLLSAEYAICGQCFCYAVYAVLYNNDKSLQIFDLLNVWNGVRLILLRFMRSIRIVKTLLIFIIPSIITFLFLCFFLAGGIPSILFYIGLAILALQFLSGAATTSILIQQFAVAPYLLCMNPLLPVSEALNSSVLLTENKTLRITAIRVFSFPLHLFSNPFIPFFFSYAFRKALDVSLSARIYDEQKTNISSADNVFFINTDTDAKDNKNPEERKKYY